jgi:hypothetical protein
MMTQLQCNSKKFIHKICPRRVQIHCCCVLLINSYTLYALSMCVVRKFFSSCFLSTIDCLKIGYGVDYVGLCVVTAIKCM